MPWSGLQMSVLVFCILAVIAVVATVCILYLPGTTLTPTPIPAIITPISGATISDGALDLKASTTPQILNRYAFVSTPVVAVGAKSVTVDTIEGFTAGHEVLMIQMQGTSFAQEFLTIDTVSDLTVTFTKGTTNAYTSNVTNVVTQLVRVPSYSSVTIPESCTVTCDPWNGKKGGIVMFKATDNITVNGIITATAMGFRGGQGWNHAGYGPNPTNVNGMGYNSLVQHAAPGESYNGRFLYPIVTYVGGYTPYNYVQIPATASGGGGGAAPDSSWCGYNEPRTATSTAYVFDGGPGGYGTRGSTGSNGGLPGEVYGSESLRQLYLGSAGGGCSADMCSQFNPYPVGGAGGGVVAIYSAKDITLGTTGRVDAQGGPAIATPAITNKGTAQSGAGSGGSIMLIGEKLDLLSNAVNALGGKTSIAGRAAGGNGRIFVKGTVSGTSLPALVISS